ncbi:MAG: UDP-N-acetylglucosamine 2-epimerase [Lachnospiraceae bacterium]|nr:UDP-N-acetylglucosamine 2-epimerase [Lachnospiraceae bacterium]
MMKICILTATRAEYGLLKPLILALKNEADFAVFVVVTGMHLSPEYGLTYQEIEEDGLEIAEKIPLKMDSDTAEGISQTMASALSSFGTYFMNHKPDMLIVLGDRHETIAVCLAAVNARIPIAHLYGGETTEGAVDEAYRHAITKMSYLHFTSTEAYRNRVIQLGESPGRVFTVGALGIENILSVPLMPFPELEKSLSFQLGEIYAVVTFHPVTLEESTAEEQIGELLKAIESFPEMRFIFTKANADADSKIINQKIDQFVPGRSNCFVTTSLGMRRYLSAVKYSAVVIGNSSSGLIEVPSLGTPTVNIGDRQKGRLQADSIINCPPDADEIILAIKKSLTDEFRKKAKTTVNPYGNGDTAKKIVSVIKEYMALGKMNLKKKFYDILKVGKNESNCDWFRFDGQAPDSADYEI